MTSAGYDLFKMIKHIKRILVALLAVAFVALTGFWVYNQTSTLEIAIGLALVVGVAFLHAHICQLVRDQNARFASRRT